MAPQGKGVKNLRKQTIKHYKAGSWTPKKLFVWFFIIIRFKDDL
jgi:hypothetical protein